MNRTDILAEKPTVAPQHATLAVAAGAPPKVVPTRGAVEVNAYLVGNGTVTAYFWTGAHWRKHPKQGTGIVSTEDDWTRMVTSDHLSYACFVGAATDEDSELYVGMVFR